MHIVCKALVGYIAPFVSWFPENPRIDKTPSFSKIWSENMPDEGLLRMALNNTVYLTHVSALR